MQTKREEFEAGSSRPAAFWAFVNERHAVWVRRVQGEREGLTAGFISSNGLLMKPWTADEIIAGSKFTNVFRELDRGTIALRRMEERFGAHDPKRGMGPTQRALLLWNVYWYRMLNREEHADAGPFTDAKQLRRLVMTAAPLFTSAHQTWLPKGCGPGVGVRRVYAETFRKLYGKREELLKAIEGSGTLEGAFEIVMASATGIGPFIAYEIVTDLQRTILRGAPDQLTWCNINRGGGSARGLRRIGMKEGVESCRRLLDIAYQNAEPHVTQHLPLHLGGRGVAPLFRIREVEHSLCEFDKYERVRTGLGTVRGGRYKPERPFDDGGFGAGLVVREVADAVKR